MVFPSASFTTFSEISSHSTVHEVQNNLSRFEQRNQPLRSSSKGIFANESPKDQRRPNAAEKHPAFNEEEALAVQNIDDSCDDYDDECD